MMQLTQSVAEKLIADMGMDDMPIELVRPTITNVAPDWFARYRGLVRQFIMSLTDSVDELAFMNLTQDEFMSLLMGTAIPHNLSVRWRVPLIWGGELSINNMFMCATFPYAHNLDRFIIMQSGNDAIWLPAPPRKIYIPAHTTSGGDGGNATEDRLAQMAAQIAAGRGMD